MKTRKTYTKTFFTNCILKNNSVKTIFHTTVKNLRGECKENGMHKGSCWTPIIFSSKVTNFGHFVQVITITKLFIKAKIWLVQSVDSKVQISRLLTINSKPRPFCVCDFIDLILSSPILNYKLFCLPWLLRKLSYVNVKESYSRRTTTIIVNVTVFTKVLSFS